MTTYPTYKLGEIITDAIGGDWGKDPGIQDESYELAYCIRGAEYKNWADDNGSTAVLRKIKCTNLQKRQLKEGDIIVEISGGGPEQPVGRTEVITKKVMSNFKGSKVLCTNFLRLIRPNAELVDSVFLNHYLKYFYSIGEIIKYQAGSNNLRNLKFNDYLTLPIPLPPLPTQHLIVSRIETLFAELDKAVQHLRTAQQQIKTYRQAVLNETMKATKFVSVGEVILEMGQGWSPKCYNEPSTNENEWGVIKTTAIQSCCFLEEENKKLPEKLEPRIKHELKVGDILITRAGPKVRVGVCCLIKKTRPKLINCDKAYRITLNRDVIDAQYFEYVINSPSCIKKLDELKTGISDSGVNLTQNRFYDLQIPLPPLAEQQRIINEIESRLSQATASETYIENALQQAEALRQSILKKAFEGELV